MTNNTAGVTDLFYMLESNKLGDVEEIKKVFHEHFSSTKDNWLVNGLFDYYLSTDSLRAVEVLAGVREPHDKHLLDKLSEALSKPCHNGQKVRILTLLGHVAKRQPTWLYKLANHALFKQMLHLLKSEEDGLSLISALLLLVTLLPMMPTVLGPYLHEIFEVFTRLTIFHYHLSSLHSANAISSGSSIVDKDQFYLLHLQVGLYNLFHRLYAMYPCNFISYLKQQYYQRDPQQSIFEKIVIPMLDSARLHPLLITQSKEKEISSSRWKNMEHHHIVAECCRYALNRCREEQMSSTNSRFIPSTEPYVYPYTPISGNAGLPVGTSNGEDDILWSPSMVVSPHSPVPSLQSQSHDVRSTPSTPGNNRSRTSPPEAAVEATPETTPVKDSRQIPLRQVPIGSAAVRALGAFGNGVLGGNSRPATPTSLFNVSSNQFSNDGVVTGSILAQKLGKIATDRRNLLQHSKKLSSSIEDGVTRVVDTDATPAPNGKVDSCREDQEVSEIICVKRNIKEDDQNSKIRDFSMKVQNLFSNSQPQPQERKVGRANSYPDIQVEKNRCEIGTQTSNTFPYEYLLLGIADEKTQASTELSSVNESRLSPCTMLDQYVETCSKTKPRSKFRKRDDTSNDGSFDDDSMDHTSQVLQLMQMQLQFERQRREVHAERNRRLLGKLRDSRAFEEMNSALSNRLRLVEKDAIVLKSELDRCKKEGRLSEGRNNEAIQHWQAKCIEEQHRNQALKDRTEALELELKEEKRKVVEGERQTRAAEATLFEAVHQLKEALKTASLSEDLKRILDSLQRRFLLLGEAQIMRDRINAPTRIARQEAALIQKSYLEELSSLRRQVESQAVLVEAYKTRLGEMESKETRKEAHLLEQQRQLQEAKERHEAELRDAESKFKSLVELNLLLEGTILELHGKLETATYGTLTTSAVHAHGANLDTSMSPKERSPPLSTSLPSSSEGSHGSGLAYMHSATGIIMNDCCDPAREIPNLQAIVEPSQSGDKQD